MEVSIDDDPLALDNRRYMVVPVREALKVLLVDGHFKSEPYQAETDYLAQALSPSEETPGQPRPIRVEVVAGVAAFAPRACRTTTWWFCATSRSSISPRRPSLDDFLKQGGGVVVFGGDQVVADNYNRLLYADGKGLLPAAIGPSVGDAAKKEGGFFFNPLGYRHPIDLGISGPDGPCHGRHHPGDHAGNITSWCCPRIRKAAGRDAVRHRRSGGR